MKIMISQVQIVSMISAVTCLVTGYNNIINNLFKYIISLLNHSQYYYIYV